MVTLFINQRFVTTQAHTHTGTILGSCCTSFPEGLCMWLLDSFMRHHQQKGPVWLENRPRWQLQSTLSLNSVSLSRAEQAVGPEFIFHTFCPIGYLMSWCHISICLLSLSWHMRLLSIHRISSSSSCFSFFPTVWVVTWPLYSHIDRFIRYTCTLWIPVFSALEQLCFCCRVREVLTQLFLNLQWTVLYLARYVLSPLMCGKRGGQ